MSKKKHWFVPKLFGWGFMPASWQGWLMTLALLAVLFGSFYSHGLFDPEFVELESEKILKSCIAMAVEFIIILSVFSLIAVKKTKGEVKWNWGFRRK